MKVRVKSTKKEGGTVQTGLVDYDIAVKYKKVLEREYPEDKHEIVAVGKKKKGSYQKYHIQNEQRVLANGLG